MAHCARRSCRRWRPDFLVRQARLGLVFDGDWFCSTKCLQIETQCVLHEVRTHDTWIQPPTPPVGRLLVQRQAITPDLLNAALEGQRRSGRRIGAELVAMGALPAADVLSALAAQAGVGCLLSLDSGRVSHGPGGFSPDAVRVLRVVPFEASEREQRLAVACTSPLPRAALAALREMTGARIEPFLVPDALHERLIEAYGRDVSSSRGSRPLRTIPDAATSIARAAERGVARRMHQVRCESYVWVRLEGEHHAEDLMVTLEPQREDTSWQAVPTRH
jgi:hypothetical protein